MTPKFLLASAPDRIEQLVAQIAAAVRAGDDDRVIQLDQRLRAIEAELGDALPA